MPLIESSSIAAPRRYRATRPRVSVTKEPPPASRLDADAIRELVKSAALDLFIHRGFGSMTLAMVAEQLDMSRTSIHYYFHTKFSLAQAVLEDYAERNMAESRARWRNPATSLSAKFEDSVFHARAKYQRYNKTGKGNLPWSLFPRFYQDLDLMTPEMIAVMKKAAREQQSCCAMAIDIAKEQGELIAQAPSQDLALQIVAMLHQLSWLTWSSGTFASVERLHSTTLTNIQRAYGTARERRAAKLQSKAPDGTSQRRTIR